MSISGFSLSSLKNTLDDVRASVYPRNETERKVRMTCKLEEGFNVTDRHICNVH